MSTFPYDNEGDDGSDDARYDPGTGLPVANPIPLLRKDLREAAKSLTTPQIRYLVDVYYGWQGFRIAAGNQASALGRTASPHLAIDWTKARMVSLEDDVRAMLDVWTRIEPTGLASWARGICGIGPVIAAGLCSHFDITKPPATVGHWWRFSGLDPQIEWLGKEKARAVVNTVIEGKKLSDDQIVTIANILHRNPERVRAAALRGGPGKPDLAAPTKISLTNALAKRPWNASLKTLVAYKLGESFVKVQGRESDFYGKLFAIRKQREWTRNLLGEYADRAREKLATFKIGADTDAHSWYSGCRRLKVPGEYRDLAAFLAATSVEHVLSKVVVIAGDSVPHAGVPMLPPAHIHARARRWTVKLFLAHFWEEAFARAYRTAPPKPYALQLPGHSHRIERPNPSWLG